jgi:4'-phosphopantetheinyl transferase
MWRSMWSQPPPALSLSSGEVHVWRILLEQPPEIQESYQRRLDEDELRRASRFHFDKHRRHFVVGRGFLRTLLARYLDARPEEVRFSYGPYGKPALDGDHRESRLQFNASHSGDWAVYGVVEDHEIGVDVELVKEDFASEGIAERFFSAREVKTLNELAAAEQPAAFFRCWTRKEAYIKAIGSGLSHPLDTFDVTLAPGEPAALLRVQNDPEAVARWSLFDLDVDAGYAAAVAVDGPVSVLRRWSD